MKFETPVKFYAEEVFTYGVSNGKYGGFSLSVKFGSDDPQLELLKSTAEENGVVMKFYGEGSSTIYLQCDQLTKKQSDELLGDGIMIVEVGFEATGTYKRKDGTSGLRLRLVKLRKVRVAEKIKAPPPSD